MLYDQPQDGYFMMMHFQKVLRNKNGFYEAY